MPPDLEGEAGVRDAVGQPSAFIHSPRRLGPSCWTTVYNCCMKEGLTAGGRRRTRRASAAAPGNCSRTRARRTRPPGRCSARGRNPRVVMAQSCTVGVRHRGAAAARPRPSPAAVIGALDLHRTLDPVRHHRVHCRRRLRLRRRGWLRLRLRLRLEHGVAAVQLIIEAC